MGRKEAKKDSINILIKNNRKHVVRFSEELDIEPLGSILVSKEEYEKQTSNNKQLRQAFVRKFLKATLENKRSAN